MYVDIEELDMERLRSDLEDEYGTAANSGFPAAMVDLFDIANATDEEVVAKALNLNYDLNQYRKNRYVSF